MNQLDGILSTSSSVLTRYIGAAVIVIILMSLLSIGLYSQPATAISTAGFKAGDIMSDAVMSNKNTMTLSQIQSFLNSKNTCKTNPKSTAFLDYINTSKTYGTYSYSGTLYKYHLNNGKFICLADQKFDGETAAHIIYRAAQDYSINPQVLLVLLQKEQGLITDNFPNYNHQYAAATGYDCPDTPSGCNSANAGFKTQVRKAANMFHTLLQGQGFNNYPVGNNYIRYNPSASCGGSWVNVKNRATGALYTYTPYQPNNSALAAGWGAAAPCGAYGNRNFYLYFTDWFGDTHGNFRFSSENLVGKNGIIRNDSVSVGGATQSISIDGKIYTFYSDSTGKSLRLTYWNGIKWTDRLVDGKGSKVPGALNTNLDITEISVLNYNNSIQVFYYDNNSNTIRHIYERNNNLRIETLDGTSTSILGKDRNVGSEISSLSRYPGDIQLFYYNTDNKSLEHTWWDSRRSRWSTETLDGNTTSLTHKNRNVGQSIESMKYRKSDIQLFYYNTDNKSLEHTWWDSRRSRWSTETLDGNTSSIIKRNDTIGTTVSGLLYKGGIQLFYHNASRGELVHTWWDLRSLSWHTERMDGDINTVLGNYINAGKKLSTAIFNNRLFVAYYDDASVLSGDKKSSWRLIYWSGTSWIQNTIEGGGYGLANSSLSMPLTDVSITPYGNNSLQMFYKGADNQLRHAWIRV